MRQRRIVASLVLAAMAAGAEAADCSRDDIDHYLDRGFTPEQVVALCGPEQGAAQSAPPKSSVANPHAELLRRAIAAFDTRITDDTLSYARELCVDYGPENLAQQRRQACGIMRHEVTLAGLEVLERRRRWLLFGSNRVRVSGNIEREFEFDRSALSARDRAWLDEALAQGGELDIPIREGEPLPAVADALRALARED